MTPIWDTFIVDYVEIWYRCETCEEEFRYRREVEEHYLKEHLNIQILKTDIGSFLHIKDEESFAKLVELCKEQWFYFCESVLITSPEYTKWCGLGWYIIDPIDESEGFCCDAACLVTAHAFFSQKAYEYENQISIFRHKISKLKEAEEELEQGEP